jgi:hypothetical protein
MMFAQLTRAISCAATMALGLTLVVRADPPKVTHDWPSYYGPDGTHADLSRVPLLDDLSQARLLWVSEHDDLGHGKTSSGGGHAYGPKSKAGGSCAVKQVAVFQRVRVPPGKLIVPPGSSRNGRGGDESAEAFDEEGSSEDDSASRQAVRMPAGQK